jgi:hypothetical protein
MIESEPTYCKILFLCKDKDKNSVVIFLEEIKGEWYLVKIISDGGKAQRIEKKIDENLANFLKTLVVNNEAKR